MPRIILHTTTYLLIVIGLLAAYSQADYTQEAWSKYYFIWDKTIALLLILCAIYPLKFFNPIWAVLGVFFVIRLAWEIPAIENYKEWSTPEVKFKLFLICLLCTLAVLINQVIKCRKSNS